MTRALLAALICCLSPMVASANANCAVPHLTCPAHIQLGGFGAQASVDVGSAPLGALDFSMSWDSPVTGFYYFQNGAYFESLNPLFTSTCNNSGASVLSPFRCNGFQASSLTSPTGNVDVSSVFLNGGNANLFDQLMVHFHLNALYDTDGNAICFDPPDVSCTIGTGTCGDVNNDGQITITDALIVAQYSLGLRGCDVALQGCDVQPQPTGDGTCNIADALKMGQCSVGLIGCDFLCSRFNCQ